MNIDNKFQKQSSTTTSIISSRLEPPTQPPPPLPTHQLYNHNKQQQLISNQTNSNVFQNYTYSNQFPIAYVNQFTNQLQAPSYPAPVLPTQTLPLGITVIPSKNTQKNEDYLNQIRDKMNLNGDLIDLTDFHDVNKADDVLALFDPIYEEIKPKIIHQKSVEKTQAIVEPVQPVVRSPSPIPPISLTLKQEEPYPDLTLVDTQESLMEFSSFEDLINDFKFKIEMETGSTELSNIAVFSALLERPIIKESNIRLTIRHQTNQKIRQLSITSALSCSIEHILYEILIQFQMIDLSTDKYLLKIHGLEEYLPLEAILCELKYIQDCLVIGQEPTLILVELKYINTQFKHKFDSDKKLFKFTPQIACNLSKNKLENILKSISTKCADIREACNENDNLLLLNSLTNLKENLKHLINLLFNISFNQIQYISNRIKEIEDEMRDKYTRQSLKSFHERLLAITRECLDACVKFVNCASLSYNWSFKIQNSTLARSSKNRLDLTKCNEKIVLYVNSISNMIPFLLACEVPSNSDLYMRFSIFYGNHRLDTFKTKGEKCDRFVSKPVDCTLNLDYLIQFENISLHELPREAVLVIQLCVSYVTSNDTNLIEKCLAWCSKAFLDNNLTLHTDEYFINFFPGDSLITCTSASNIYSDKCAIIHLSFIEREDVNYYYPDTIESVSDFQAKEFDKLDERLKKDLQFICQRSITVNTLSPTDKQLVRDYSLFLQTIQNSLSKIYLSCTSWDYRSMANFCSYLKQYESLSTSEALELLLPYFPNSELRTLAVKSLKFLNSEALALYLPQLLESLRYERTHNSSLTQMLIQYSVKNIRFAHKLYWKLNEFKLRSNEVLCIRYELLLEGLKYLFSKAMTFEIEQEKYLVDKLDKIAAQIKTSKDMQVLHAQLSALSDDWPLKSTSCRLPYDISFCTNGLDITSCSFISSFTVPLKLVFKNVDSTANTFYTLYKTGDDLRQDIFVIQMIQIMNQLWLTNGLDLKMLTFSCLQTGDKRGFIEMITNAETLREIQKGAVKNALKKSQIYDWLRSHNPGANNFTRALNNFTRSCAGYTVATYILGIGDRHNDNIMIKYSGHLFHIDFGKYLGDAQTFAGIKRDRTPMLFTQDMAFVINQGKEIGRRFQEFIELCCRALQILRDNYGLLLTLIEMMHDSGIPGLNKNAKQFVLNNLMLNQSCDDVAQSFTKMIHDSLKAFFPLLNNAIHTFAQSKTSNTNHLFSFVTQNYSLLTDGRIETVMLDDEDSSLKNTSNEEYFKCVVMREYDDTRHEVFRTFDEFCELYQCLVRTFPQLKLSSTPILEKFTNEKRNRKYVLGVFINDIFKLQPEIRDSDTIYTFFHKTLRDQTDNDDYETRKILFDEDTPKTILNSPDIKGQIKIKLRHKDNKFVINVLNALNLKSSNSNSSSLKTYVKAYLKPDSTKKTKQKVHAYFYGPNPIFNRTIEYDITLSELKTRTLEIIIACENKITNEKIGSVEIMLNNIQWCNNIDYIKWYDLR